MRRTLRLLVVVVVVVGAAACSDGEPAEPWPPESSPPAPEPAVADSAPGTVDGSVAALDESGADVAGPTTVPAFAMTLDELNVGYLPGWFAANQAARGDGTYDEALGLTVNWVPVATGAAMVDALEALEIDIAYSQDVTAFAIAVNAGSDLRLVGVAAGVTPLAVASGSGDIVQVDVGSASFGERMFGVVSTTGEFALEHPDVITGFLAVTDELHRAYNTDRSPFVAAIAAESGLDAATAEAVLDAFVFPTAELQMSEPWLGGALQRAVLEWMTLLAARGDIASALPTYEDFIDTAFLSAVR